jgi:hypothetical protein
MQENERKSKPATQLTCARKRTIELPALDRDAVRVRIKPGGQACDYLQAKERLSQGKNDVQVANLSAISVRLVRDGDFDKTPVTARVRQRNKRVTTGERVEIIRRVALNLKPNVNSTSVRPQNWETTKSAECKVAT